MNPNSLLSFFSENKDNFSPDDTAVIISTIARKCGNVHTSLMKDIVTVSKTKVYGMSAKGIATTLLSTSKLRVNDKELLRLLTSACGHEQDEGV